MGLTDCQVNCMSNKKAWSRGMIDAAHADKLPPCFLDVEQAVEARDDPTKREAWHEGGIYLKLATGVEGKVQSLCSCLQNQLPIVSVPAYSKYLHVLTAAVLCVRVLCLVVFTVGIASFAAVFFVDT